MNGVISEGGSVIKNSQDNKTKRYLSDNESNVKHHEIKSNETRDKINGAFNLTIQFLNTTANAANTVKDIVDISKKYDMDLQKTREEEKTKREQINAELTKTLEELKEKRDEFNKISGNNLDAYREAIQTLKDSIYKILEKDSELAPEEMQTIIELQLIITDLTKNFLKGNKR